MATDARMDMNTDLLTLAQWLSPAYPLGSFAYSHGLEWAVATGDVDGPEALRDWLANVLEHGTGWNDALFLSAAFHAPTREAVAEINATALAFAGTAERRAETVRQGTAFAQVTAAVWNMTVDPACFPVALGRATALAGLPREDAARLYLQSFHANLVAAAQRLMPLGQTAAQRIVHDLAPLCRDLARRTADGDLDRLGATALLPEIAAMKHETQHTRIFRT
jgi:urease accessory protein